MRLRSINNQRGVTLIELSVVGVLIGVLAALAVPNWFDALPKMRTKAEVRNVISTLREARSLAVAKKVPFGVTFDYAKGECKLFMDTDSPEMEVYAMSDSVIATDTFEHGVQLRYDTFNNGTVLFRPDGSATTSGHVCISSEDYMYQYSVDVLASTGRVKLYEGYPPAYN